MSKIPEKILTYAFSDVNDAYPVMHGVANYFGQWEETRNGRALAIPVPVAITHHVPWRRVLFCPKRDANPFFHYMESIWMLSGRENVDFPARFARNIQQYSDDGVTLHGAYGYRWRHAFERDQIETVIHMLTKDPASRRCVINMWDPYRDLERNSKDLPCNTQLLFRVIDGALDMTVINRSNDLVWGMLGANVVHMSVLQEYIANALEIRTGSMHQFSINCHIYEGWEGEDKVSLRHDNWYLASGHINRWLFSPKNIDLDEMELFVDEPLEEHDYNSRILRDNARPMLQSWLAYKAGDIPLAAHHAANIYDEDWAYACNKWLQRRVK